MTWWDQMPWSFLVNYFHSHEIPEGTSRWSPLAQKKANPECGVLFLFCWWVMRRNWREREKDDERDMEQDRKRGEGGRKREEVRESEDLSPELWYSWRDHPKAFSQVWSSTVSSTLMFLSCQMAPPCFTSLLRTKRLWSWQCP